VIQDGVNQLSVRGGTATVRDLVSLGNVRMVEICALTHKLGVINTTKEIKRDSEEEEEFLEDLVRFMKQSEATSQEPLFNRRTPSSNGVVRHKVCRPHMVTAYGDQTRAGSDSFLLPFAKKRSSNTYESPESIKEETLARGNYSKASVMIDTTYNYNSSATGPLGAMNSNRAKVPDREDIARKVSIPYQK
jgi:hypothetical protein